MEGLFSEREGRVRKTNKYLYVLLGIVVALLLISIIIFIFTVPSVEVDKCGDGTIYGTCSLNKPYYCSEGELVRNVSFCGCPDVLERVDGECYSDFYEDRTELMFEYYLGGVQGHVGLYYYPQISEYLNSLPRSKVYGEDEVPRRDDFKLNKIEEGVQREALIPLLVAIQNKAPDSVEDQAKIAISLVQNIKYGEPETQKVFGFDVRLSRYPYQVLGEGEGSCEGKSELLAFLLKEMGYGTSLFYYSSENHEAVGIKCPLEYSLNNSGYCFVETTVPAPISYSTGSYLGISGGKLVSSPDVVILSKGFSLPVNLDDYADAQKLSKILDKNGERGSTNIFQRRALNKLREKYSLNY